MKKCMLSFTILLITCVSYAQKSDSTHTHYAFYRGLSTHVTELKSKRGILNGEYKIFNGKQVAALGMYKDNQRIGRWQFFGYKDTLAQVYNYTTKKVEYNKPSEYITYQLDTMLKEGDTIQPPVKIGSLLNYYFLTRYFKPPYIVQKGNGKFGLKYIFRIDSNGKLTKYETSITSENYDKNEEIDLRRLKLEDFDFFPAQLNGKNISSTIVIDSYILVGRRD